MVGWIRTIAALGLIAAFILPSLGYAWARLSGQDQVSTTERRPLAPFPAFDGSLRDFTTGIDAHLEDGFGFRPTFIRLARKVKDNLGENPPLVVYGKDGWLFLGENVYRDEFEGNGYWTVAQRDAWIDSLTFVNTQLSARNVPFAAIIAPDKSRIYPEKLPDDWVMSERRFRSSLHDHPQAVSAGLIDVEPPVLAAKSDGQRVYYMRDTHWTPDAGWIAVKSALAVLDPQGELPRMAERALSLWSPKQPSDLDGLLGRDSREPDFLSIGENYTRGYSIDIDPVESDDDPAQGSFATFRVSDKENISDKRLILVGDSFADVMVAQLKRSYGEVVRVYHGADRYRLTLEDVLEHEPDAVLFVAVERNAVRMDRPFDNQ